MWWYLVLLALVLESVLRASNGSSGTPKIPPEDWSKEYYSWPAEVNDSFLRPYRKNMKMYNQERPTTPNHLLSFLESLHSVQNLCGRYDRAVDIFHNLRKLQPIACAMDQEFHGFTNMETMKEIVKVLTPTSNHTKRTQPGKCVFVFFYSRQCEASRIMLLQFYLASTFFPHIHSILIDAFQFYSLNTDFGIIGVPTAMLFHQGQPVRKCSAFIPTNSVELIKFLWVNTNQEPIFDPNHLQHDFSALYVPFANPESDPYLTLAWSFIALSALYKFVQTAAFLKFVDLLKRTRTSLRQLWNESHQHAHIE